ncbi:hypothetical protein LEP1GSC079_1383 [Leptospira interrogans str. FPW1039]|uniref:Uncharacterized protein n=1 Tax=Leptospira interrogans str. FPW1039 TaxID=1193040 RepID=A0A0F6IG34_LEPIR|nr:hypothetical protein LEP1GSC045_4235 [Leptospira interrogans serovar Pomona str. Kennewicki LC82-25]EKN95963.1 hypothetical protein LEP1GSC014_4280 [Leptospira interrogans serovar Pomona str. Pomona]EKO68703.1 hypothetical protein LEP1GSC069_3042 [Leptospira interrogans serovar Canicola str. Fiocruz LV133]EKR38175.1 hypothetical protein LEP1GSC096_0772 [Leptospira interrogans serovar Hebdomadis str. R499]EKR80640.1 hypothetical protein LEP1GSC099_2266 [Leptospira interrogans str. UI 08452]E
MRPGTGSNNDQKDDVNDTVCLSFTWTSDLLTNGFKQD